MISSFLMLAVSSASLPGICRAPYPHQVLQITLAEILCLFLALLFRMWSLDVMFVLVCFQLFTQLVAHDIPPLTNKKDTNQEPWLKGFKISVLGVSDETY